MFSPAAPSRATLYASRAFKAGMDVVKSERLDASDGVKPVLTFRKTGKLPGSFTGFKKTEPRCISADIPS